MIASVTHYIRAHRYSTPPEPRTLEAMVVSDADNLDALGATGIARVFTYGGERGNPIAVLDPSALADFSDAEETSLEHIEEKILCLKERMYTDSGRARAVDRHSYVQAFVDRFDDESAGRL